MPTSSGSISSTCTEPQASATLLLLREAAGGLQVLLQQRVERVAFGGVWAFPGGVVEAVDYAGFTAAADVAAEVAAARAAAVRETLEETGVDVSAGAGPPPIAWSRWITPATQPRRFDTWFFAAAAPPAATLQHASGETQALEWVVPGRAVEELYARRRRLLPPTLITLLDLEATHARHGSLAAMLAGEQARTIVPLMPQLFGEDGAEYALLPWDASRAGPESVPDYLRGLPSRVPVYR
jgi:8-oxo-dGTP pyrophosphatase MutT (NUDIX family)